MRRSRRVACSLLVVCATLLSCQINFSVVLEPGSTAQQVKVRIFFWHHPSEIVRDLIDVAVRSCDKSSPDIWRMTRVESQTDSTPMFVTLGQSAPDGWKTTGSIASFAPGCYAVTATSSAGHGFLQLQVAADGSVAEVKATAGRM